MTLHTPEFAADPHSAYQAMRDHHGPLVPLELAPGIPATLIIGYREALQILSDPLHFPADPRESQSDRTASCPVLPTMGWRPGAPRTTDPEYARNRSATTDCLNQVDLYALRATVERIASRRIDSFCEAGSADLLNQYAIPLTVEVVHEVLGFGPENGRRAFSALIALRNAADAASAQRGDEMLTAAIAEAVAAKQVEPGTDVTSWLLQHGAAENEKALIDQVATLYVTGTEPTWNLIANTVLLLASDDRFGGELLGGALSIRDAIDEVLFTDPPVANSCFSYPRQPQIIGNTWLPVDQPVLISLAACNADPAAADGDRTGNRSHLSWGAGAHSCPAQSVAMVIAQEALDQLLDALPEVRLAVPEAQLHWRTGGFHRALAALPVRFPPSPPLNLG
ncbi:cytochrome P450 [Nocardia sp. CS682]|uniref:cytochrome P450 n=1 Tax=Nocardia sp. CS682 TaxID=1047172 RepID=UPI0010755222|nr:cytochrome P450 [Nocardia sp. CS682]QBS39526.1 cytochrome P450 [Nocardia sp. CS682]